MSLPEGFPFNEMIAGMPDPKLIEITATFFPSSLLPAQYPVLLTGLLWAFLTPVSILLNMRHYFDIHRFFKGSEMPSKIRIRAALVKR
jgi:hypothetical protein